MEWTPKLSRTAETEKEVKMGGKEEKIVYRISSGEEWEELQKSGSTFGGDLDKASCFIHLSQLHQLLSLHTPTIS